MGELKASPVRGGVMSSKHIPYFTFYPSDFMNGVRGMTPQEVGVYTMLLCRIYEENGPVEVNMLRLSTYCGMREKSFQTVFQKLLDLGKFHLVDGAMMNSRAEREIQKRSNDLKSASIAGKASARKRQKNQSSVATPVQPPFNHTDTDTDTIKEEPKGSYKRTGNRLAANWVPSERDIAFAASIGMAPEAIQREADQFRDYWISKTGKDATKLDWEATWRGWVRRAHSRTTGPPRTPRKTAFQEHQEACARELDKVINRDRDNDHRPDNVIDLGTADYRYDRASSSSR